MARTFAFESTSALAELPTRRSPATPRHVSSKLQEIALRSPRDLQAIDVIADLVLEKLNEQDRQRAH